MVWNGCEGETENGKVVGLGGWWCLRERRKLEGGNDAAMEVLVPEAKLVKFG